jgi:chemotaxis protein methyltransferase CheR
LTAEHLARLRGIVVRRLGLRLEGGRDAELAEAFGRRLVECGRVPETTYLDALDAGDNEELKALGQLLTVGETYFFRAPEHFDVLRDAVLPSRPRCRGDDLNILSAGCSTGEEPYSLAIFLHEYERRCLPATWLRWHVRALDLGLRAIGHARAGVYSEWSLRGTRLDVRDRWFMARGPHFEVRSEVRSKVTFEANNLLDDRALASCRGMFDVVFCRNVLMYFTPESARTVVEKLASVLAPGGVLFLGYAESLRGVSDAFTLESSHGTFYHRRGQRPAMARSSALTSPTAAPPDAVAPSTIVSSAPPVANDEALSAVRDLVAVERFDQALEALQRISPVEQAQAPAAVLRAIAHLGSGEVGAAASVCSRLLEAGTESVDAHVVLGLVAEHRGEASLAIEHHRAAAYLEPNCALSRLHLGRIQRRAGQLDEARRELGQALDLLEREDPGRLLLFAGGFGRDGLLALCRNELALLGEAHP